MICTSSAKGGQGTTFGGAVSYERGAEWAPADQPGQAGAWHNLGIRRGCTLSREFNSVDPAGQPNHVAAWDDLRAKSSRNVFRVHAVGEVISQTNHGGCAVNGRSAANNIAVRGTKTKSLRGCSQRIPV